MPLRVNVDRALGQQGKRRDVLCAKSLHPKLQKAAPSIGERQPPRRMQKVEAADSVDCISPRGDRGDR
jgi:hypothetical protein